MYNVHVYVFIGLFVISGKIPMKTKLMCRKHNKSYISPFYRTVSRVLSLSLCLEFFLSTKYRNEDAIKVYLYHWLTGTD